MAISEEVKELFKLHPESFVAYYFPHAFKNGMPSPLKEHHIEMLHASCVTSPVNKKYYPQRVICLNEPAGHGKTITIDHHSNVYDMCHDPDIMITLIPPKLKPDGEGLVRDILDTLTTNEKLIEDYGPFEPPKGSKHKWGVDGFSVAKRTRKGRDETLQAVGFEGVKPGFRSNKIIPDDVVNDENATTVEQRSKIITRFTEVLMKRMADPTYFKIIVPGTKYGYGDLYHYLEEMADKYPEEFLYIRRTAILDENNCLAYKKGDCAFVDTDGNHITHALWPEMYPLEFLLKEREQDPVAFDKTRMNIVIPRERLVFAMSDIIACQDANRMLGDYSKNWTKLVSWDMAQSANRKAARCAIHVWGYDSETEKRYLIDMFTGFISLPEQINKCLEFYERYDCVNWIIEKNAMQGGVIQIINQNKPAHVRITPHYTGKNKLDPITGIEGLIPLFEGRHLVIPYRSGTTRTRVAPLVEEFARYPAGEYTDNIMAAWFAELAIREGTREYFARYLDNPGSPYEPRNKWVKNPAFT